MVRRCPNNHGAEHDMELMWYCETCGNREPIDTLPVRPVEVPDVTKAIVYPAGQGRWIPVSERKPEKYVRVMIWFRGTVDFGEVISDGHWRPQGGHGNFDDEISYWMPTPAQPYLTRGEQFDHTIMSKYEDHRDNLD